MRPLFLDTAVTKLLQTPTTLEHTQRNCALRDGNFEYIQESDLWHVAYHILGLSQVQADAEQEEEAEVLVYLWADQPGAGVPLSASTAGRVLLTLQEVLPEVRLMSALM